jgi:phage terminase small subunit
MTEEIKKEIVPLSVQEPNTNVGNGEQLTFQELQFCELIDDGMSATQAVLKIYTHITDYNVAANYAFRLLKHAKIKEYRREQKKAVVERYGLTLESLLADLVSIAGANLKDFIDENNEVKDISKMPRQIVAAVESIETTVFLDKNDSSNSTCKTKFKLYNKLDAIEKLAKHLGLYEKDNDQKTKGLQSFAELVRRAATCTEQPTQQ